MGKLLDSFMEYLWNTPEDQVLKEWKSPGNWDDIGPTLGEFLELYGFIYQPDNTKQPLNINYEKSETQFRTFF
ncbi:MAG: hypothetical protein LBL79_05440 [Prevotella sp.]|jgi:hypothetical protein|nr:hypothetical protein [Prevotella sp.]